MGSTSLPQGEEYDDRTALESIPAWFWAMLGGIVGIAGFSVYIRLNYPEETGPRGTIALVQLSLGFVSMIVAHLISSKYAMKHDRRMNFNDVLLSWFNVWQPTISALPNTCKRVWAFVWGAVGILTAVTVIGGIDYSAPFRTHEAPKVKPLSVVGAVASAARAGAKDASMQEAMSDMKSQVDQAAAAAGEEGAGVSKNMEDALNDLGNMEDQLNGLETDDLLNGRNVERKSVECFIYGVITDDKNVPTSFLFAANTLGKEQHVAELETKDIPKDKLRTVAMRLYKEVRKAPVIASERKAVWVNPEVKCSLSFVDYAENGELTDPKFDTIVVNQPGRFDSSRFESNAPSQRR